MAGGQAGAREGTRSVPAAFHVLRGSPRTPHVLACPKMPVWHQGGPCGSSTHGIRASRGRPLTSSAVPKVGTVPKAGRGEAVRTRVPTRRTRGSSVRALHQETPSPLHCGGFWGQAAGRRGPWRVWGRRRWSRYLQMVQVKCWWSSLVPRLICHCCGDTTGRGLACYSRGDPPAPGPCARQGDQRGTS